MLKKWKIKDFKSIQGELSLDFSPLTILVGANSSGKSSILQSILLLKQTLENSSSDKALTLNGPILKLGTFKDVLNIHASAQEFAFEFSLDEPEQIFPFSFKAIAPVSKTRFSDINMSVSFGLSRDPKISSHSELYPSLKKSRIQYAETKDAEKEPSLLALDELRLITISDDAVTENQASEIITRGVGKYKFDADSQSIVELIEDRPEGNIKYATALNFIPYEVVVEYNFGLYMANQIAQSILQRRNTLKLSNDILLQQTPQAVIEKTVSYFSQFLNDDEVVKLQNSPMSVKDYIAYMQNLKDKPRTIFPNQQLNLSSHELVSVSHSYFFSSPFRSAFVELLPELTRIFYDSFFNGKETAFSVQRPNDPITYTVHEFFTRKIKYLGPIRDEPRPSYSSEAFSRPDEIGYKGERTSAVFELQKSNYISYVPSSCFTDQGYQPCSKKSRLDEAAEDWLSYLGVTNKVLVNDRGKYGHELQVRVPNVDKPHDLTNVGVGVSQILPVVVLALMAQPHSVLVFEQPELHLHPKVQSRLADFFISLIYHNKQCIIETHSEYLVHRLRRRIAEMPPEKAISKLAGVYFIERDENGTQAKKIEISEFGAIVDWPEDFMDQSQSEIDRILEAASLKFRNSKK